MIEMPNIKEERRIRNWTQKTLADLSGVSLPTIVRMEKDLSRGSVGNLTKVTDIFERHNLEHFVYIMNSDSNSMVKVGHTKNLQNRWNAINYSDQQCEIAHHIKCGYWRALRVEDMFKRILSPLNIRGEWFACSKEQGIFILDECYSALNESCPEIQMDWSTNHFLNDAFEIIEEKHNITLPIESVEIIVAKMGANNSGKPKSGAWKHVKQIQALIDDNMDIGELAAKYGTSEATIRRIGKAEL